MAILDKSILLVSSIQTLFAIGSSNCGPLTEVIAENKLEDYMDRYKTPIRDALRRLGLSKKALKAVPRLRGRLMCIV